MADEDGQDDERPLLGEWRGWAACLAGAVMPTLLLASIAAAFEKTSPAFIPALFIGLFTLAVIVIRPWTIR